MTSGTFILNGRTSQDIAGGAVSAFGQIGDGGIVIQSRFGTFGDGESIFELFVDGKLPDHPIEQNLSPAEKKQIKEQLAGAHVIILHSVSGENTSSRAMSLLHGIDYLKNSIGVAGITLIAPHLPYMRNDREFRKTIHNADGSEEVLYQFNAVSGSLYAKQLKIAGVDSVVGFEPHSQDGVNAYRSIFGKNVKFINMGGFFAENIGAEYEIVVDGACNIMVGSPDGMNKPKDFGIARAASFANALYSGTDFEAFAKGNDFRKKPFMFAIHKERIDSKTTKIMDFYGDVAGKICIVIDDIISSGGTTLDAANALRERGARQVIAIATHAVLVNGALPKLLNSPWIDKVMITDTIPGALEKAHSINQLNHEKLVFKTISPLVNQVISEKLAPSAKPRADQSAEPTPQFG